MEVLKQSIGIFSIFQMLQISSRSHLPLVLFRGGIFQWSQVIFDFHLSINFFILHSLALNSNQNTMATVTETPVLVTATTGLETSELAILNVVEIPNSPAAKGAEARS